MLQNEGELNAELRNDIRICQEISSNEATIEADSLHTSVESR